MRRVSKKASVKKPICEHAYQAAVEIAVKALAKQK